MKHKHKDFPYKTPTGPVATKKKFTREEIEKDFQEKDKLANKTDDLPSSWLHDKTKQKIEENKQRSRDANKQERIEDAQGL